MGKIIYKVAQKLFMRNLLPWFIWSPIYDRWNKRFDVEKKYDKKAKVRKG